MRTNDIKILQKLNKAGIGTWTEINDVLSEIFPGIDRDYAHDVIKATEKLKDFLSSLTKSGLIEVLHNELGVDPTAQRYLGIPPDTNWLDKEKVIARLTYEGKMAISTFNLNASTKRTNKALQENVRFQEKAQLATLLIAIVSVLFLIASVYESHVDQTDENLSILIKQQQEQKRTFDSINNNLEKLYKAVQTNKNDSLKSNY